MEQYKIVIDTLGSDKGPEAIILGASLALKEHPDLFITLIGPESLINEKIKGLLSAVGLKVPNTLNILKQSFHLLFLFFHKARPY